MMRRSLREMSLSDPEHLPKIGICSSLALRGTNRGSSVRDHYFQYEHGGIPRLPPKLLRRQHTWHDVSMLTRDVDVIEQITTSV